MTKKGPRMPTLEYANPSLLDYPIMLPLEGELVLHDYGARSNVDGMPEYTLGNGKYVQGDPTVYIHIGTRASSNLITILDFSHTPIADTDKGLAHCIGHSERGLLYTQANTGYVITKQQSFEGIVCQSLLPEQVQTIGRKGIGGSALHNTVSRRHTTICVDRRGSLHIAQHSQSSFTAVRGNNGIHYRHVDPILE